MQGLQHSHVWLSLPLLHRFKWQLPAGIPAGVCEITVRRQVQDAGDSTVGAAVGVYRDTKGTFAGLALVATASATYNVAL